MNRKGVTRRKSRPWITPWAALPFTPPRRAGVLSEELLAEGVGRVTLGDFPSVSWMSCVASRGRRGFSGRAGLSLPIFLRITDTGCALATAGAAAFSQDRAHSLPREECFLLAEGPVPCSLDETCGRCFPFGVFVFPPRPTGSFAPSAREQAGRHQGTPSQAVGSWPRGISPAGSGPRRGCQRGGLSTHFVCRLQVR